MGDRGAAADGPPDPPPQCKSLAITTRNQLSRRQSWGQGQTIGKGKAPPPPPPHSFTMRVVTNTNQWYSTTNDAVYTCTKFFLGSPQGP